MLPHLPPLSEQMSRRSQHMRMSVLVVLIVCAFAGYVCSTGPGDYGAPKVSQASLEDDEDPGSDLDPIETPAAQDFSRFSHSNEAHSRMPCLSCHRRDTNA